MAEGLHADKSGRARIGAAVLLFVHSPSKGDHAGRGHNVTSSDELQSVVVVGFLDRRDDSVEVRTTNDGVVPEVTVSVDGEDPGAFLSGFPVGRDKQVDRDAGDARSLQQQFVPRVVVELDTSFLFDAEVLRGTTGAEQALQCATKFGLPGHAFCGGGTGKQHREPSLAGGIANGVVDPSGVRRGLGPCDGSSGQ